ncbi:unnamed protein product [Rhodiola kirilowii]
MRSVARRLGFISFSVEPRKLTRSSSYPSLPTAYVLCGSVQNPKPLKSQFLISFLIKIQSRVRRGLLRISAGQLT